MYAFLQRYGLENEIKVNIEVNHATLAGHDFAHEIATAVTAGIFGSIDANAGDDRLGWDLDRFPVSVEQMTLGMLEILRGGGFTTGGMNFDAKLRRQSIDRNDLFHAHIGGMDTMARALLVAAVDPRRRRARSSPRGPVRRVGRASGTILDGKVTLQQLHDAPARHRQGADPHERPPGSPREPRRQAHRTRPLNCQAHTSREQLHL